MKRILFSLVLLFSIALSVKAQMPEMPQLPLDPAVRYGKLENGLTYYIRHNDLPEHQADFYIAQRVGSVLEEESQRGLAHFLEHMAFNGLKNFPKKGMLEYLQKNGVKFGTNVNAYTSFDETVYNICNVPTTEDHPHIVDSCLLMLHDWSGFIALEDEEIDNERGVIHEEWRQGQGAQMRMLENALLPKLMGETLYPVRLPIGTMEVVDNFKYQELRDYYHKWYRPDLQGIVIVGDVDVDYIEAQIKELWKDIPAQENPAPRTFAQINNNEEPLVAVGADKEYPMNVISFGWKSDALPFEMRNTQMGLINDLVESVITGVFNQRFAEAVMKGSPMLGGGCMFGEYVTAKTKDAVEFQIVFKENEWKPALDAMIDMVNTAKTYGFSAAEIARVKAEILANYENAFNEKDKRKNSQLTGACIKHFTDGESMLSIEMEYQIMQQLLEALPDEVYTQALQQALTDENQFIYCMAQEKEGSVLPTEEELVKMLKEGLAREAQPYEEAEVAANLMETLPAKGSIVKTEDTDFGFKVWTLSNGAKVVWKQTDFKKDQILMSAISPVGYVNLNGLSYAEQNYISAACELGGFANFSMMDLQKVLAGKKASVDFSIEKNAVSIDGNSTPKDFRTMMEMMYLSFTQPRMDEEAYASWFNRTRNQMANQEGTPDKIQSDSLLFTMYKGQEEMYPTTLAEFDKISYANMFEKGKELTKNAADFTFFFIGNIEEDSLRVMAEQYIASLPSAKKPTKNFTRDYTVMTPGSRENRFDLPMTQAMTTVYNFFNVYDQPYDMKEQLAVSLLAQIAQMTFTETIREREGGVYSPGASAGYNIRAGLIQLLYYFVTGEDKLAHIEDVAYKETCKLADEPISEDYFQKSRDYLLKAHQEKLIENRFWLGLITEKYRFGNDTETGYVETLNSLTPADVQAVAKKIIYGNNRIQFVSNGVEASHP